MSRTTCSKIVASLLLLLGAHCAAPADTASEGSSVSDVVTTIEVKPFLTIGSGRPGAGENDVNAPDGLVFDAQGNLLLTDAMNHRVQVWDVKKSRRLGQFGTPEIFRGEIVDLAVSPTTGQVIVTDEDTHVAYPFDPPKGDEKGDLAFTNYTFRGDMFQNERVVKVGGITFDSKGRIYTVDARQNLVRRYMADGKPDTSFKFEEKNSGQYLQGCEGIAVDEKRGNLYVASEFESVIRVFDLKDGSYKNQMIGRRNDPEHPGTPTGQSVFQAAVEGLWILDDYLLAADEADGAAGHVQIFDLRESTAFDTSAEDYAKLKEAKKRSGYVGGFGDLSSPDSVTAFTDKDGQSFVAVADQGHYQVLVYKWADIVKAGKFARP